MGGNWNPSPPPIRPGFYINFETAGSDAVAAGNNGIVGLPITADWGPVEEFVLISSDAIYKQTYGGNNAHTSYLVQESFRGGAAQVLAYRVTDGNEAAATIGLVDEGGLAALPAVVVTSVVNGAAGATDEVWTLDNGGATTGTFTLTFDDGTTTDSTAVDWDETAASLDTLLEAFTNVGTGNIAAATDLDPGPTTLTFGGALTNTYFYPGFTISNDTTDGTGTTVVRTTPGVPTDEIQNVKTTGSAEGTFTLTALGDTTGPISWNATAAELRTALGALPAVGGVANIQTLGVSVDDAAGVDVRFIGALAATNHATMTGNDANLAADTDIVLTLTAKYPGTRGNTLRVTIEDNPLASVTNPKTDVKIYENSDLREKYTYADLDHADIVAKINDPNDGSDLVIASLNTAHAEYPGPYTVRLDRLATGEFLEDGLDGVPTSGAMPIVQYTNALDAFERQGGFDIFTLPDVHDNDYTTPGIIAAVVDWTNGLNDKGQYVMTVIGGDAGETVDEAIARSEGADSEWIINVGRTDLRVTYPQNTVPGQDVDGRVDRRTAALTARVAGEIASAGIGRAITFVDVAALDSTVEIMTPMTIDEIEDAILNGVIVFTKRGPRVVVEDGVTTFTTFSEEKDETFGNIRAVRTMQKIGRDFNEIIEAGFIGQQSNSSATRSNLLTVVQGYLGGLEEQGALVPGSVVQLDDRFDNTKNNIYLLLLVQFSRELKRVLMTLRAPLL